jgi:uncharacterized protein YndB with AHSA1/START domain
MSESPVGLTKDAGWEIGVSRTLPVDLEDAWRLLDSDEGRAIWLGEGEAPHGEVRSRRPEDRIRVTWQPAGRETPATAQVVLREGASGTRLNFHTEKLESAEDRERVREHWKGVLDRLEAAI